MPSLADLIGRPPPGDIELLQATVSGAPGSGVATIHFGDPTQTLSGVRALTSASFSDGDSVWVLKRGGSLIILGRLAATSGGVMTSPGLELYHPSSTPYIDFHSAASPAGDSNADYNIRLINDATGQLSVLGGKLVINGTALQGTPGRNYFKDSEVSAGNGLRVGGAWGYYGIYSESGDVVVGSATGIVRFNNESTYLDGNGLTIKGRNYVGVSGAHGTLFAQFSHSAFWNTNAYGYMQSSDGSVYISSSGTTYLRINNSTKATWSGSEFYVGDGSNMRFQAYRFDQLGNWDVTAILSHSAGGSSGTRLSMWDEGHNAAGIWQYWGSGAYMEHRNWNNSAWGPIWASAFTVNSQAAHKEGIVPLRTQQGGSLREKARKLKPVHFKWDQNKRHGPADASKPTQRGKQLRKNEDSGWFGLVVEDVEALFPEAVVYDQPTRHTGGWKDDDPLVPTGLDVMSVVTVALQLAQEAHDRLDAVEAVPVVATGMRKVV